MHHFVAVKSDSKKPHRRKCPGMLTLIVLMMGGMSVFQCACRAVETVWSAEARSPDGFWLAIAETQQHGGFGTAGVVTTVYLKRTNRTNAFDRLLNPAPWRPIEILELFHDPRTTSTTINLSMRWSDRSHLEITYKGRPSVDFQVMKCADIEISVDNQ
jgi:hypothetical protein